MAKQKPTLEPLIAQQQRFGNLCQRVSASLTAARLTPDDLLATLPAARSRIYARRYGKARTEAAARIDRGR